MNEVVEVGQRQDLTNEIESEMRDFTRRSQRWTTWSNWILSLIIITSSLAAISDSFVFFGVDTKNTGFISGLLSVSAVILSGIFAKLKFTANSDAARTTGVRLKMLIIKLKDPEISFSQILKEYVDIIGANEVIKKKPD